MSEVTASETTVRDAAIGASPPTWALVNGRVITPERIIAKAGVLVQGMKIAAILRDGDPLPQGCRVIDTRDGFIAPGFIDLHLHGGGGADLMDGTVEAILQMVAAHARTGTTAMVPSTLCCSMEDLRQTLANFKEAQARQVHYACQTPYVHQAAGATLLGIHLEGPYFSPAQKGAQDPRYIKNPDPAEYLAILDSSPEVIRVSAACELPGALELGRELRRRGILAAIGHSDATFDEVVAAVEAGYSHVTHLYSGMSGVRRINAYRVAGLIEAGLLLDALTVEIIADGRHLPTSLLKLIYKCKGPDRIVLITDAMRGAGMPEGEYILGGLRDGQKVIVEEGVAKLPDRSAFAGSVATANLLVKNMVELAEVPLPDAVKMMTSTPARILGVWDRKGGLDPGKDADIVVFNESFTVSLTAVEGRIVYHGE